MTEFSLGNQAGDHLKVDVLGREHPSETDYWDGNWIRAVVSVSAGPWRGSYEASLRADEIAGFRDQLQTLYSDVSHEVAQFSSMEPWLNFGVRRTDGLGHIEVSGEARREPFFEGHTC